MLVLSVYQPYKLYRHSCVSPVLQTLFAFASRPQLSKAQKKNDAGEKGGKEFQLVFTGKIARVIR